MLEVRNHTPLSTALIPGLDKDGYDYAVVIMKGCFNITPNQPRLVLADEPAAIFQGDEHYGDPVETSVRYESDTSMVKRGTDIVVNGHAYAPGKRATLAQDVSLQVGNLKKTCRVFGDRHWEKSLTEWNVSQPQKFERMPLVYENAYGGIAPASDDNKPPESSTSNPLGKGYLGSKGKPTEGLPLPNLEDPRHLIQKWTDRPPLTGFGYISRGWQPRIALAGTYDAHWQKKRLPLLPLDFDERYFNGAHPDLITPTPLSGGEHVILTNMSESGAMEFDLPVWRDPVTVFMKNSKTLFQPVLDTVVIEPDTHHVLITWRVTVPCPKQFLYIDTVIIGKQRPT
jgi:hypothetical protein